MGQKPCHITQNKTGKPQIKTLACRMTMLTVMTMFLIYPFTLSTNTVIIVITVTLIAKMTLAVYYCSKQKIMILRKNIKIGMTQMTLMTLNLGYV